LCALRGAGVPLHSFALQVQKKHLMASTSINIQPCKVGSSEQHNERTKQLDYVKPELSHLNESWRSDNKTLPQHLTEVQRAYKAHKGKKMHAKATPLREGVIVIDQSTTMQDLLNFAKVCEEQWGLKPLQIHIHRDEGHMRSKEWKPNLHAHIVWRWTDENGITLKLNRYDMVKMQTLLAKTLGMERGVASDKEHLSSLQWKNQREEEQKILLETETERLKVGKARKEAAIETAKSVSEGVKTLLGISTKEKEINALRNEINRQKQEIRQISIDAQKKIDEQEKNWKQKVQSIANDRDRAQESVQEEMKRTGVFVQLWNKVTHLLDPIISLATDRTRTCYNELEVRSLDKTLGETSIENRLRWANLFVLSTFRHLLSSEFRDRYREVLGATEQVAKRASKYQKKEQEQNQTEQRSRGMRR
jgi:hypothetical protein